MKKEFVNPIDPKKVAENPSLLPYAHHVGSAIIKPIDKGKVKGLGMSAMYEQTEDQLLKIKEQVTLLLKQAQQIHDKISISEIIYKADCGFKPRIGQIYHVFQRLNGDYFMSMIAPSEWGSQAGELDFVATVELMSDHTWQVREKSEAYEGFSIDI